MIENHLVSIILHVDLLQGIHLVLNLPTRVMIRNCVLTSNFPRVANLVNIFNLLCPEGVNKCLENDLDMEETLE